MNLIKPSFSTGYAKNASESANPNLWKGLVGAWMPSFGVTGNTLKDVSGNGNDGTLTFMDAATDWVATSKGLGLEFGFSTYENVSVRPEALSTNAGSFFCWYKRTSVIPNNRDAVIFSGYTSSSVRNFLNVQTYSKLDDQPRIATGFNANIASNIVFGSAVYLNKWMHLGYSWVDGEPATLWVNGRLYAQTSGSFVDYGNYSSFKIGNYSSLSLSAGGVIADAFSYNRVLSPSEIKQLYLNPSAPFQKKTTTVVSVPVAPPTTTAKAVVLKKPKPSYATGYARNASESANPNLWKGLVGAWMPSFGVTGGTLRDVSGNGNDGTLTNMDAASDWVATSKGLALDFDGVDDFVSIPDDEVFKLGNNDFSLFCNLFFRPSGGDDCIFEFRGSAGPYSSWVWFINANNRLQVWKPNLTNQSSVALVNNSWCHIGLVRKNNVLTYFINGNSSGSSSWSENADSDSSGIRIGTRQDTTNSLSAKFTAAHFHNRALSPSEIKQLYLNPSAPFLRKQQTVGLSTAQAFNPYWANQATQLAGTLQ